jgi:hypothetical protein
VLPAQIRVLLLDDAVTALVRIGRRGEGALAEPRCLDLEEMRHVAFLSPRRDARRRVERPGAPGRPAAGDRPGAARRSGALPHLQSPAWEDACTRVACTTHSSSSWASARSAAHGSPCHRSKAHKVCVAPLRVREPSGHGGCISSGPRGHSRFPCSPERAVVCLQVRRSSTEEGNERKPRLLGDASLPAEGMDHAGASSQN